MVNDLSAKFAALTPIAKARVLARLILMETVHVRGARLDDPSDSDSIYSSSEFVHRLSGFILTVLSPDHPGPDDQSMIEAALLSVRPRGKYYVDQLSNWISAEDQ